MSEIRKPSVEIDISVHKGVSDIVQQGERVEGEKKCFTEETLAHINRNNNQLTIDGWWNDRRYRLFSS